MKRFNRKGFKETYFEGKHLTLEEMIDQCLDNCYLKKQHVELLKIPVEFHVTKVIHVTTKSGLYGILEQGFKLPQNNDESNYFLWWDLHVSMDDIASAERRYLQSVFPDITPHETEMHPQFLSPLATSPAFQEASRYGNFKFTFQLEELLEEYSRQFCGSQRPVLRVYETVLYRREIQHTVVVHRPEVNDFNNYPILQDNKSDPCAFRDEMIIWRPRAISDSYKLKPVINQFNRRIHLEYCVEEYYVWEHVSLAFHLHQGETFDFPRLKLLNNLSPCEVSCINLVTERLTFKEAEKIVMDLKQSTAKYLSPASLEV